MDQPARRAHPALALLGLSARRREQEIAYHELKVELRASGDLLLASHTPDTAAQEIAALLVALAIVARTRLQATEQARVAPLRVSFGRPPATLQPRWLFVSVGAEILQPDQQRAFIALPLERLAARLLPPRRARRSPRTVRQPIKGWLRTTKTQAQRRVTVRSPDPGKLNHFTALRLGWLPIAGKDRLALTSDPFAKLRLLGNLLRSGVTSWTRLQLGGCEWVAGILTCFLCVAALFQRQDQRFAWRTVS